MDSGSVSVVCLNLFCGGRAVVCICVCMGQGGSEGDSFLELEKVTLQDSGFQALHWACSFPMDSGQTSP